jgi:DNA-binding winged helix-turn-helix (wHTH) protein
MNERVVLIVGVPDPVASRWSDALRVAGHLVVRIDVVVPESCIHGDAFVLGRDVPPDTDVVSRVRGQQVPTAFTLSTGRLDLTRPAFEHLDGRTIALTAHETGLLRVLADAEGEAVERDRLLREVWGHTVAVVTRSVDNTVARLRMKIERDPGLPEHLLSARGSGYRLVGAQQDATAPARVSLGTVPAAVTLIGRSALMEQVGAMLGPPGVVTLLGAPGVGKSALAAAVLAGRPAHAAVDPTDLTAPPPGSVLLVDDADPHIASIASALPALVARGACVLVTSRTPLNIAEERRVRVPPLPPDDAARLLVLRSGRDDPAWAEVARLLEGSPLAIELSAHAARLLSGGRLLERLADPIAVLMAPHRHPERHRSWIDAVGWTWCRLDASERACATWAAQRIFFDMDEADQAGAWRAVATLVEGSLLTRVGSGFSMSQLTRAAVAHLVGRPG